MKFDYEGFITTSNGVRFTRYRKPRLNQPTIIFLNGLSYSTTNWSQTIEGLNSDDLGILLFDFCGQGKSLDFYLKSKRKYALQPGVSHQAEDVIELMNHFRIEVADLLTGLSYGGGIGFYTFTQWPDRFKKFLAIAPYIMRLDHSSPTHRIWAQQMKFFKLTNPASHLGINVLEAAYTKFLTHYMHKRFESEISCSYQREAAIRLSLGIMPFSVFDIIHQMPRKETHLVIPGNDTLIPHKLSEELWNRLPENAKQSHLYIEDAHHIVPSSASELLGRWIDKILFHQFDGKFHSTKDIHTPIKVG